MHWFRDLRIRWKLSVLTLATSGTVLLVACAVFFIFDQISFRRYIVLETQSLAGVVGANSAAAITFRDEKVAEQILSSLGTKWHVFFATISDASGQVLAKYRRIDLSQDLVCPPLPSSGYVFQRQHLWVESPVSLEGEQIGKVMLCYSLVPLRTRLARYTAVVGAVFVAMLLAAWALTARLQSYVAGPIMALRDTADEITSRSNFTLRAGGAERGDEIGELVVGFNSMLGQLEQRDAQLEVYRQRLRTMASMVLISEERERRRISMGLHDSICQLLWIANLKLKILSEQASDDEAQTDFAEIADLIDKALTETRALTFELSPPVLYEFGLEAAFTKLVEQMAETHGMNIIVRVEDNDGKLTEDVSVLFYRSVRELLINAYKYARSNRQSVTMVRKNQCLRVTVADDGVGFDPEEAFLRPKGGGFGLFSIRERFQHGGGRMEILSAEGEGTSVVLELPIEG